MQMCVIVKGVMDGQVYKKPGRNLHLERRRVFLGKTLLRGIV